MLFLPLLYLLKTVFDASTENLRKLQKRQQVCLFVPFDSMIVDAFCWNADSAFCFVICLWKLKQTNKWPRRA